MIFRLKKKCIPNRPGVIHARARRGRAAPPPAPSPTSRELERSRYPCYHAVVQMSQKDSASNWIPQKRTSKRLHDGNDCGRDGRRDAFGCLQTPGVASTPHPRGGTESKTEKRAKNNCLNITYLLSTMLVANDLAETKQEMRAASR